MLLKRYLSSCTLAPTFSHEAPSTCPALSSIGCCGVAATVICTEWILSNGQSLSPDYSNPSLMLLRFGLMENAGSPLEFLPVYSVLVGSYAEPGVHKGRSPAWVVR